MKYVYNPRNGEINPVTNMTFVDKTLTNKEISPALYSLVCKGIVSKQDIAALFAADKSPEILVKNYKAVQESAITTAPDNTNELEGEEKGEAEEEGIGLNKEDPPADVNVAFDGRALNTKKVPELLMIATSIDCPELKDPDFAPTRPNLMKAIKAKATAAEDGVKATEVKTK